MSTPTELPIRDVTGQTCFWISYDEQTHEIVVRRAINGDRQTVMRLEPLTGTRETELREDLRASNDELNELAQQWSDTDADGLDDRDD